jgi:hypothetical protein
MSFELCIYRVLYRKIGFGQFTVARSKVTKRRAISSQLILTRKGAALVRAFSIKGVAKGFKDRSSINVTMKRA